MVWVSGLLRLAWLSCTVSLIVAMVMVVDGAERSPLPALEFFNFVREDVGANNLVCTDLGR